MIWGVYHAKLSIGDFPSPVKSAYRNVALGFMDSVSTYRLDLSGVGRRYRLTFAAEMVQPGQSPFGE